MAANRRPISEKENLKFGGKHPDRPLLEIIQDELDYWDHLDAENEMRGGGVPLGGESYEEHHGPMPGSEEEMNEPPEKRLNRETRRLIDGIFDAFSPGEDEEAPPASDDLDSELDELAPLPRRSSYADGGRVSGGILDTITRELAGEAPIDKSRPIVENDDNTFSTESTIGIEADGKHYNIPTIVGGKRVSDDEAVKLWRAGKNREVGVYGSREEADSAAPIRSERAGVERRADRVQDGVEGAIRGRPNPRLGNRPAPRSAPAAQTPSLVGQIEQDLQSASTALAAEPAAEEETSQFPEGIEGINEREAASQPARAIATRKGGVKVQGADLSLKEPPERSAPWTGEGGVLTNAPAGMVAAAKNAAANLQLMVAEERRHSELEAGSEQSDPAGYAGSAQFRKLQKQADERRKVAIKAAEQAGAEAKTWAAQTKRELELVTPEDMDTMQQGVWAIVQSAPPTMLGISVGILTRNPWLAMSIAGGGGGAQQAGATYGTALEHGAGHRKATGAAGVDAILESVGEALPLSIALKQGSPFVTRLANTMMAEAGQEGVTQVLQDLNAYLVYNPDITVGEAWHNLKVATIAGALGGAVYGTLGQLAERKPEERPAITEDQARSIREQVTKIMGGPVMEPLARVAAEKAAANFKGTHRLDDGTMVTPKVEDGKPVAGVWQDARGTLFEAKRAEPVQTEPNATWTVNGVPYEVEVTGKGSAADTVRLADGQEVSIAELKLEDEAKVVLGLMPDPDSAEAKPGAIKARPAPKKKATVSVKADEFKGQSGGAPAAAPAAAAPEPDGRIEPTLKGPAAKSRGEAEPPPPRGSRPEAEPAGPPPKMEGVRSLQRQNRLREGVASVAQMNQIANAPDYERLSFSKAPETGAPMASIAGDVELPAEQLGRKSVVVIGGEKVPVRYAVVEASKLMASHTADGTQRKDYFEDPQPGQLRALNNGRAAGLREAYARNTAGAYRAALADAFLEHGVTGEAIEKMERPVLVRLYPDEFNTKIANIGEASQGETLEQSPLEIALQDAAKLKGLDGFTPSEDGDISAASNDDYVRSFISNVVPENQRGRLFDQATKKPNKAAYDRIAAAIFQKAYGSKDLTGMFAESADPEIRSVLAALAIAAPDMSQLDGAPELVDIRPFVAEAAKTVLQAKRAGVKLETYLKQQDLEGRHPLVQQFAEFMAQNIRSPRKMGEGFKAGAKFVQFAVQDEATGDIFGDKPKLTVSDALKAINKFVEAEYGEAAAREVAQGTQGKVAEDRARYTVGGAPPALPDERRGGRSPAKDAGTEGEAAAAVRQGGRAQVEQPPSTYGTAVADYAAGGRWTGEPIKGVIEWNDGVKALGSVNGKVVVRITRPQANAFNLEIEGWEWADGAKFKRFAGGSGRERARIAAQQIIKPDITVRRVAQPEGDYTKVKPIDPAGEIPNPTNDEAIHADPDKTLILIACSDTKAKTDKAVPLLELYQGPLWQTLRTHLGAIPTRNIIVLSGKWDWSPASSLSAPYEERLSRKRADQLIGLGIDRNIPMKNEPKTGGPYMPASSFGYHVTTAMTSRTDIGSPERKAAEKAPWKNVVMVGGKDYMRVMHAAVTQMDQAGMLDKLAAIPAIEGGIGEMRKQLGEILAAVNDIVPAWRDRFYTKREENGQWRVRSNKNTNPISPGFDTEAEAEAWAVAFDKESAVTTPKAHAKLGDVAFTAKWVTPELKERGLRIAAGLEERNDTYSAQRVRNLLKTEFAGMALDASRVNAAQLLDSWQEELDKLKPVADVMAELAARFDKLGMKKNAEGIRARDTLDGKEAARLRQALDGLEKPLPRMLYNRVVSTGESRPFVDRVQAMGVIADYRKRFGAGRFEPVNVGGGVAVRVLSWPGGITEDAKDDFALAAPGHVEGAAGYQPHPYPHTNDKKNVVWKVAHALRDGMAWAAEAASKDMVAGVPPNAILVPMPGHDGSTRNNARLARQIQKRANGLKIKGVDVREALEGEPRESQYEAKKAGKPLTADQIKLRQALDLPAGRPVLIVDGVIGTGTTMGVAMKALKGRAQPLVYARDMEASSDKPAFELGVQKPSDKPVPTPLVDDQLVLGAPAGTAGPTAPTPTTQQGLFGADELPIVPAKPKGRTGGGNPGQGSLFQPAGRYDSAAFKAWFGDSKVVDDAGRPLVVYHGTTERFTTFDFSRVQLKKTEGGFFFAENEVVADDYGDTVMRVYLSIQNPYVVDWLFWMNHPSPTIAQIKAKGHDGIVIEDAPADADDTINEDRGRWFIAFEPTQIKSVGNRGTFDPSNPNILEGPVGEYVVGDLSTVQVEVEATVAETGAKKTVKIPADAALRAIDDNLVLARRLHECLHS